MMIRIHEERTIAQVLAPQSAGASTEKTSSYIDACEASEVAFVVSCAPLGAGKSLTVTLLAADDASGSGAAELKTTVFTDAAGTQPQAAVVSYQVRPENGRYIALKVQHDGAAAVVLGIAALCDSFYRPQSGGWVMTV